MKKDGIQTFYVLLSRPKGMPLWTHVYLDPCGVFTAISPEIAQAEIKARIEAQSQHPVSDENPVREYHIVKIEAPA